MTRLSRNDLQIVCDRSTSGVMDITYADGVVTIADGSPFDAHSVSVRVSDDAPPLPTSVAPNTPEQTAEAPSAPKKK